MSTIVTLGHKALHTVSDEVEFGSNVTKLIMDMKSALMQTSGVGIAANQIAVCKRVIFIRADKFVGPMINPVIVKESKQTKKTNEGCLSVPNFIGKMVRKKSVTVEYYDEKWNKKKKVCRAFLSSIVQHEIDHLNGITIGDQYV